MSIEIQRVYISQTVPSYIDLPPPCGEDKGRVYVLITDKTITGYKTALDIYDGLPNNSVVYLPVLPADQRSKTWNKNLDLCDFQSSENDEDDCDNEEYTPQGYDVNAQQEGQNVMDELKILVPGKGRDGYLIRAVFFYEFDVNFKFQVTEFKRSVILDAYQRAMEYITTPWLYSGLNLIQEMFMGYNESISYVAHIAHLKSNLGINENLIDAEISKISITITPLVTIHGDLVRKHDIPDFPFYAINGPVPYCITDVVTRCDKFFEARSKSVIHGNYTNAHELQSGSGNNISLNLSDTKFKFSLNEQSPLGFIPMQTSTNLHGLEVFIPPYQFPVLGDLVNLYTKEFCRLKPFERDSIDPLESSYFKQFTKCGIDENTSEQSNGEERGLTFMIEPGKFVTYSNICEYLGAWCEVFVGAKLKYNSIFPNENENKRKAIADIIRAKTDVRCETDGRKRIIKVFLDETLKEKQKRIDRQYGGYRDAILNTKLAEIDFRRLEELPSRFHENAFMDQTPRNRWNKARDFLRGFVVPPHMF